MSQWKVFNVCSVLDYIPGSDKRNDIRTKINQCFDGIGVHGLPMLSIPDGEDVDYPYLSGRFKDGLASLASSIIQRLPAPRYTCSIFVEK